MDPPPPASRWGQGLKPEALGRDFRHCPPCVPPEASLPSTLGVPPYAGSSFHCPHCLGLRGTLREGKKEGEEHGAGQKCQRGLRAQVRPPRQHLAPFCWAARQPSVVSRRPGGGKDSAEDPSKSSLLSDCCWSELGQGEGRQSPRPPQPRRTESHVLVEEPTGRGS